MDILSNITPFVNGGFSAFNLYILFRIMSIEKEVEREKKFFLDFRNNEDAMNKELDQRLRNLELECHKRWSTWKP